MILLSAEDLTALTGKQRPGAQRRALERMGIPHYVRPDGRPVVTAGALDHRPEPPQAEPNWGALMAGMQPSA